MGRIVIVLAALISMGTAANATTLVSGAIYAPTQQSAWCILYNGGGTAVSVSGRITNQFLGSLPLAFNGCTQPLAAGAFCGILANIPNKAANACTFVVPSGQAVRGTFLITTGSNYTPLTTSELR